MIQETLGVLAALATVGGFVLQVATMLYRFVKRRKARTRMMREEASDKASGNGKGQA